MEVGKGRLVGVVWAELPTWLLVLLLAALPSALPGLLALLTAMSMLSALLLLTATLAALLLLLGAL